MKRVFLLEDDPKLSDLLTKSLQAEGIAVGGARTMEELEAELEAGAADYDAILMDRLIHGVDSRTKLARMKARWPRAAVLVLSAINTPLERADLINAGADDYLGKPFLTQELLARLRSLLRRGGPAPEANYRELGNSVLNLVQRTVGVGAKTVALPAKEFLVLKLLAEDPGRVINRNEILDSVWGLYGDAETNVVEATITNLRRRLSSIGSSLEIRNMRNSGYWLEG